MATTTFSGPVRAGDIKFTTGTTLGSDVSNVGTVVLSQATNITQTTGLLTDIVIPANSTIIDIKIFVRTAWTGAVTTFGIGTSASDTALTAANAVSGSAIGPVTASPGTDATRTATWVDVGTTDVRIKVVSANSGSGVGTVVVSYIQNNNLL
jgi:hypothetical protein